MMTAINGQRLAWRPGPEGRIGAFIDDVLMLPPGTVATPISGCTVDGERVKFISHGPIALSVNGDRHEAHVWSANASQWLARLCATSHGNAAPAHIITSLARDTAPPAVEARARAVTEAAEQHGGLASVPLARHGLGRARIDVNTERPVTQ